MGRLPRSVPGEDAVEVELTARREGNRHPAALLLVFVAGVLLLASVFGPVTSHGIGSAISARALADLLLGGAVEAWAPRWSGLALYLHPTCGALVLISAGVGGRTGRRLALVALTVSVVGQVILIVGLAGKPLTGPGWGALAVYGGLAAAALSLVVDRTWEWGAQQS